MGTWLASRPALHGPRSPLSGPLQMVAGACAALGSLSLLIATIAFSGQRLDEARLGTLGVGHRRADRGLADPGRGETAAVRCPRPSAQPHGRGHPRPRRRSRPRARPHPRPRRRSGDAARVRRFPVSVLRPGRADDPRAPLRPRRRCPLRLAAPSPRTTSTPHARLAAEATEAAAAQGRFWEMHDTAARATRTR